MAKGESSYLDPFTTPEAPLKYVCVCIYIYRYISYIICLLFVPTFFVFVFVSSLKIDCLKCVLLQMWEDLIRKAKDGGLDAIDTYVFWNVHEPSPGNVPFWNLDLHLIEFSFKFSSTVLQCFWVVCYFCSTILKGGTIWYGSLRQCKGWGSMCIFGLDLMCVLSGTLGTYTFNFPLWISLVCWCECECLCDFKSHSLMVQRISCLVEVCSWHQLQNR